MKLKETLKEFILCKTQQIRE